MAISEYLRNLRTKIGHEMVMMPGITAVVINEAGEILFHQAKDDGHWYLIGGAMDPGEEPADALIREVWEETGVEVVPERIIGVYAEPLLRYPNQDEVLYTSITFLCRPVGGQVSVHDEESFDVRYFSPSQLPPLTENDRLRLEHAMSGREQAYFRITLQKVGG